MWDGKTILRTQVKLFSFQVLKKLEIFEFCQKNRAKRSSGQVKCNCDNTVEKLSLKLEK